MKNREVKNIKSKQYSVEYEIKSLISYATNDLASFQDYSIRMEGFMIEEFDKYNQYLDDMYIEYFNRFKGRQDLGYYLEYQYPDLFRKSLYTNIFSFVEKTLNSICVSYEERNNEKNSFRDMDGNGIDRAKAYLTKVKGLDVGLIKEWEQLKAFQKVRNLIVHNYSEIQPENILEWEKIKKDLKCLIYDKYPFYYKLRLDNTFINNFFNLSLNFFKALKKQLTLSGKKK